MIRKYKWLFFLLGQYYYIYIKKINKNTMSLVCITAPANSANNAKLNWNPFFKKHFIVILWFAWCYFKTELDTVGGKFHNIFLYFMFSGKGKQHRKVPTKTFKKDKKSDTAKPVLVCGMKRHSFFLLAEWWLLCPSLFIYSSEVTLLSTLLQKWACPWMKKKVSSQTTPEMVALHHV